MEDSMLRLQEYTGITNEEIQELLKADVVRHDTDHPHRLYSVPASGRHAIGEQYRQGIDYGHGKGDPMSPVSTCSRLKSSAST